MDSAPPLQSWLTAPLIAVWEPGRVAPLLMMGCVYVAASVLMVYLLADELGDARWAFLSAVCLSLHPQLLILVQTAAPDTLSFFLLVVTAWGLWGHLNASGDWVSFRLMIAGIAWGLLLLAGGPLASRIPGSRGDLDCMVAAPMGPAEPARKVLSLAIRGIGNGNPDLHRRPHWDAGGSP